MAAVLTLDLGNTSLKGVLWEKDKVLLRFRRLHQEKNTPLDDLPLNPEGVSRVLGLASRGLLREHGLPGLAPGEWVGRELEPPLQVEYDHPEDMGWDRRVASFACFQKGKESLILDAGTCLTLTHVDGAGLCRGFGIAPGLAALARTSGIFAPDLEQDLLGVPKGFPTETRGTKENLEAGVWAAFIGAAKELLGLGRARLKAKGLSSGSLVLTGSDGELLQASLGEGSWDPILIHRGLLSLAGEGE
jgi:pantothenate kinase type III